MNQLKLFLQGKIAYIDPSIIDSLGSYDSIKVGDKIFKTADIIHKIHSQGCPTCLPLRRELTAVKYQLKLMSAPKVPSIEVLLTKFFEERFERIPARRYSRKQLFIEVNLYLKSFGLQIIYQTDSAWVFLITDIIKDTSKNYRKLKIKSK